ncbi:MAG: di-heme oxidoredictase family protein [Myxococcota bacterium]
MSIIRPIAVLLAAACTTPNAVTALPAPAPEPDPVEDPVDGPSELEGLVPLYDATTELEPDWIVDVGDAIVTRFADRGRDRHAREDEFQAYDHYLAQYWDVRTARIRFVDRVAKGGDTIDVSIVSEWRLSVAEFRSWYRGIGTVAEYHGNYAGLFTEEGPGTFDIDHVQVSDEGTQFKYAFTLDVAFVNGTPGPLQTGQFMEFESSQFLAAAPGERQNYYGTTGLYAVGVGGLVPWRAVGVFGDGSTERENSHPIDEAGWLGGRTTLPYQYSNEPDNHFMQMATNLSSLNGQTFVLGRRVHHTDMIDGTHDENAANGVFGELTGLAGPYYARPSCDSCHTRNGRARLAGVGEPLEAWVVQVGQDDGTPHPAIGRALQPRSTVGAPEGSLAIERWNEGADGLREPDFAFSGVEPARFSARIAPPLVGMGLLEAIPEATVLGWADPDDVDGDGISGRVQRVTDPVTGETRLGRFGWKAGAASLRDQTAGALNTDMGVMTSVRPDPDCGTGQTGCGPSGAELADEHLDSLVKYVALLGVRARRDLDDPVARDGEAIFADIGCAGCHVPETTTSPYHPLAEVRSQTIHPYTDLLLHDLGPGLASTLGQDEATGAEWRTPPLWGLGLGACVTGGVAGDRGAELCVPDEHYLHDGRARTLDEAIRWHGGEADATRQAYEALDDDDQDALSTFLRTL